MDRDGCRGQRVAVQEVVKHTGTADVQGGAGKVQWGCSTAQQAEGSSRVEAEDRHGAAGSSWVNTEQLGAGGSSTEQQDAAGRSRQQQQAKGCRQGAAGYVQGAAGSRRL